MDPERSDDVQPDEQHVQETPPEELATEDALADLQAEPGDSTQPRTDLPGLGENTAADLGGAGGGTTADPGRQNPIIPGEGRL